MKKELCDRQDQSRIFRYREQKEWLQIICYNYDMLPQESIDYVKTQMATGSTQEKITSDLLDRGWTVDQVNEVFQAAQRNDPVDSPQPRSIVDQNEVPNNIKYFEWLMGASVAVIMAAWFFRFVSAGFPAGMIADAMPGVWLLVKLFCVYQVVYYRIKLARTALAVIAVPYILIVLNNGVFIADSISFMGVPIVAVLVLIEVAAMYFVFTSPANAWLKKHEHARKSNVAIPNATTQESDSSSTDTESQEFRSITKDIMIAFYISALFTAIGLLLLRLPFINMFLVIAISPFVEWYDSMIPGEFTSTGHHVEFISFIGILLKTWQAWVFYGSSFFVFGLIVTMSSLLVLRLFKHVERS